jgi:hypothetical protein
MQRQSAPIQSGPRQAALCSRNTCNSRFPKGSDQGLGWAIIYTWVRSAAALPGDNLVGGRSLCSTAWLSRKPVESRI